jgi:hypothetical protein
MPVCEKGDVFIFYLSTYEACHDHDARFAARCPLSSDKGKITAAKSMSDTITCAGTGTDEKDHWMLAH